MFYLLFSVAFAVLALFYILNGMRKGKKYIWSYSLARTIVAIVSAVASAFLSSGLTFFFVKIVSIMPYITEFAIFFSISYLLQ